MSEHILLMNIKIISESIIIIVSFTNNKIVFSNFCLIIKHLNIYSTASRTRSKTDVRLAANVNIIVLVLNVLRRIKTESGLSNLFLLIYVNR